jgi:hypothetical protein
MRLISAMALARLVAWNPVVMYDPSSASSVTSPLKSNPRHTGAPSTPSPLECPSTAFLAIAGTASDVIFRFSLLFPACAI